MSILVLAGDLTNYYLFNKITQNNITATLAGFGHLTNQRPGKNLNLSGFKLIIVPIPFSIDGFTLYSPYGSDSIHIETLLKEADKDCRIIGGPFAVKDKRFIDLTTYKTFTDLTVTPTVEELIKIIIDKSDITISESNILITGDGRVSKKLKHLLNLLNAKVNSIEGDKLNDYDIIVNTYGDFNISNNELDCLKKDCLIIDATANGCKLDYKYAKKTGLSIIRARGLPGKSAPKSVSEYIYRTLIKENLFEYK